MTGDGGVDTFLKLKEVGRRPGLSSATICAQIRHGRIPGAKRGRDPCASRADVEHSLVTRSPSWRYREDVRPEGYVPPEGSGR